MPSSAQLPPRDLPPYLNISLAQAQRNIAEVISSYMIVVSPNGESIPEPTGLQASLTIPTPGTSSTLIQQALDSLKDHVSKTSPLVSGFLKLQGWLQPTYRRQKIGLR